MSLEEISHTTVHLQDLAFVPIRTFHMYRTPPLDQLARVK